MSAEPLPLEYDLWYAVALRAYLLNLMREAKGNQCKAAELAGIHRNTISRMLGEVNLHRKDWQPRRTDRPTSVMNGDQSVCLAHRKSPQSLPRPFSTAASLSSSSKTIALR